MTPKQQLEALTKNEYESEDGEWYKASLLPGKTPQEITAFKDQLPEKCLLAEIEGLLNYSTGFAFNGLEIRFDTYGYFGFTELFPRSIELAGDGFGNFWILDIDEKGKWNAVYFVCHDPPVLVKQAECLSQFIEQLDEWGKKGNESQLDIVHEQVVTDIWKNKDGIMKKNEKDYDFEDGQTALPPVYLVADLTDQPVKSGFTWGLAGPKTRIIRPTDRPIWVIEKKVKQGFLPRLFGGKGKKN